MIITRCATSRRRLFSILILTLIVLHLFIQFASLQTIFKANDDFDELTLQQSSDGTPLLSDKVCSWTRPIQEDAINHNMDWSRRQFNVLFRKIENMNSTPTTSCPETDLWKGAVPFYLYPQHELFSDDRLYWENMTTNDLSRDPMVKPIYHRVDARYENAIIHALFSHPLRVDYPGDAQLFILPVPFGVLYFDTLTSIKEKRLLCNQIGAHIMNSTHYQQRKPHVIISMTNPILDHHRRKQVKLGRVLYQAVANMSVARGDDHYAARYVYKHHVTTTNDFRGFDEHFSATQPVTEYTFSVGLGGQAMHLPLQIPSWEKFQKSSLFLFYHTRATPPFESNSGKFREAPIRNVSSTALPSSSIGWSIPWEKWNRDILDSKFCLVMRGDTPHSHSLLNAVKVGCLPVVISDWYLFYAPPFPATLDMRDFCIFLSEGDFLENPENTLKGLLNISNDVMKAKLRALQWAQRVVIVDHPESLFVPAFIREAMNSFSRPKSKLM